MDSFNWKVLTLLTGKEIFTLVSLTVDNITIENIKGIITFPENNEGPFRIELNLIPEQKKLFSDAYETSESYSLVRIEAFGSNEKYISECDDRKSEKSRRTAAYIAGITIQAQRDICSADPRTGKTG